MASPAPVPVADPGKLSIELSRVSLEAGGANPVNHVQQVQAVTWRGRVVRKALEGVAIGGGCLFAIFFTIGAILNSQPTQFAGVGCGLVAFMSLMGRLHCLGDYDHEDLPLE